MTVENVLSVTKKETIKEAEEDLPDFITLYVPFRQSEVKSDTEVFLYHNIEEYIFPQEELEILFKKLIEI